MSTRRITASSLPLKLRALFGSAGLTGRLMVALDRGHTSVEDILSGRNIPPEIVWIVECLERLPVRRWPRRWAAARGDDAERHVAQIRGFEPTLNWTDAELEPARDILLKGGTYAEAAKTLNLSKSGVAMLARRGRLPRSKSPRGRKPAPAPTDPVELERRRSKLLEYNRIRQRENRQRKKGSQRSKS